VTFKVISVIAVAVNCVCGVGGRQASAGSVQAEERVGDGTR